MILQELNHPGPSHQLLYSYSLENRQRWSGVLFLPCSPASYISSQAHHIANKSANFPMAQLVETLPQLNPPVHLMQRTERTHTYGPHLEPYN